MTKLLLQNVQLCAIVWSDRKLSQQLYKTYTYINYLQKHTYTTLARLLTY